MKSPTEYIREAWAIYTKKENFVFFARMMAVLAILSTVIGFISSYFYPADYLKNSDFSNIPMLIGFISITLLAGIIGLWSQTTTYFAILKMGSQEKEVFKLGYKYAGEFLLVSLAIGIIVMFGAVLLVFPAIIFGVWYSFSLWLVLDKDLRLRDSLKQSKALVKGKFWKVLGRSIVFGFFTVIISAILTAIPYAGPLAVTFVAPLFMLPFYLLYKDLSAGSRLDNLGTV